MLMRAPRGRSPIQVSEGLPERDHGLLPLEKRYNDDMLASFSREDEVAILAVDRTARPRAVRRGTGRPRRALGTEGNRHRRGPWEPCRFTRTSQSPC